MLDKDGGAEMLPLTSMPAELSVAARCTEKAAAAAVHGPRSVMVQSENSDPIDITFWFFYAIIITAACRRSRAVEKKIARQEERSAVLG